jgi:hypothetical protein
MATGESLATQRYCPHYLNQAEHRSDQQRTTQQDLDELGETSVQRIYFEILPGVAGAIAGGMMRIGCVMQMHVSVAQMHRRAVRGSIRNHVPMKVQAHQLDQQHIHGA